MAHRHSDARTKNIDVMGPQCGELYTDLYNEILWLHIVWQQFRTLSKSEARIELINRAAGFFFYVLQVTLWDGILLHIARLTDPPRPRRRDKSTLTLLRLSKEISDPALADKVRSLVGRVGTASDFAHDWRDRRIAHIDLELLQSPSAEPLPDASEVDVEAVLTLMRQVVHTMERHYFNKPEAPFDYASPLNDAEALICQLQLARMVQDERDARWKAGDYREDDFKRPPEI